MAFVIPEPPRAAIPVEGSHELFPVRRIFCVGRNYAEHVREMGGDPSHVYGYAAGLDMTRRDLQAEAKKGGRAWDMSKGFDFSAPIGEIVPASRIGHPARGSIELKVNGKTRQ